MPVYNSERFLAEAIESILQQTFTDFEFLIVDDGSTDGSLAIIQDYAEHDSRIRILQLPVNKGEAIARNTGIAQASGKLITGIDSDDISLPQRLEKQVAYLEAHSDIGGVGVFHRVCNEDLTTIVSPRLPTYHHSIVLNFVLYIRTAMKCANMMLRREYLDMQPLYDPTIAYSADVDLFMRLVWENGIRYANLPEELYLYRRHDNTMSNRHQAMKSKLYIPVRRQALGRLGAPGRGVEWIIHKHPLTKLTWSERRRARRDITRLIEAMVAHNWVDADDEPLLYAEMNQLLESTTPRYWQMFLNWYRYRIARHIHR